MLFKEIQNIITNIKKIENQKKKLKTENTKNKNKQLKILIIVHTLM